jgi:hypothetical protein
MPPGSPNPSTSPLEVPAQPATPDIPPEYIGKMTASPAADQHGLDNRVIGGDAGGRLLLHMRCTGPQSASLQAVRHE